MPLFLPFVVLIGAEIWTLIEVGSRLGPGATLLWLGLAAMAGGMLIRAEGFAAMRRFEAAAASGESPAAEMMASMARLLAGLLLIFPGFLTDGLAVALLIPAIRRLMAKAAIRRFGASTPGYSSTSPENTPPGQPGSGRIIEGKSNRIGK